MAYHTFPAPVHLGVVTSGGDHAQLHRFTGERNLSRMERLLKTGVDVDCVNHQGQTPLFCAALRGHVKVTDLLLDYGADPNHRCEDRSTPVHAGVFSCNPSVVSRLLDAGGDLRLHDQEGRTPFDWLRSAPQEGRARMEDFLQSCMSTMQQLFLSPDKMKNSRTAPYSSTSSLLQPVSLLDHIIPRDKKLNRKMMSRCLSTVFSLGFGKLCVSPTCTGVCVPASVPVIRDSDLTPTDDQPLLALTQGPLMSIHRSSWRGSTVSVKSLTNTETEHQDLLIAELQYCSQLLHPHLLQLMAVSVSDGLLRTSLVFERIDVGTLHNLLHTQRAEFPVLLESWILTMILQVCEGLQFLHNSALVMRALSSHSVVLTQMNMAKLTGLGFMAPSNETTCVQPPCHVALPPCLHRWAAPEVIKQRVCREEADIYSLCALILELYTDDEPWGTVDLNRIKLAMDSGQPLTVHSSVPQPYHGMVQRGLQLEPQNRTCSLQSLIDTLQQDLKRLSVEEHMKENPCATTEQDPGSGVQTTKQQTRAKEPVQSGVGSDASPVSTRTDTEEEGHEHRVHQLDRDRHRCTTRCAYSHISSRPHDSDSDSDDEESESGSVYGAPEPIREMSEDLRPAEVDREISTILVNLKVSKELLRQAHRSLDTVEKHQQLVNTGEDLLDSVTALRDASPCIYEPLSFPMSSADLCWATSALGPPSERYTLLPQGGDHWTENLTAQLLSRDFELLSEEELSLWLSLYPAMQHSDQSRSVSGLSSGEPDLGSEEPSCYVSAVDDSILFKRKQQKSSSEDDADITVEVCRPAASGTQLQGTYNTKCETFSKHCEETGADEAFKANTTMAQSDMALFAELSSIACSPAQPQQKICSPSVNTPALPYNSTPQCPDGHQRVKIMKANLPQSLVTMRSFNALLKGSSGSEPSPCSVDRLCSPQTFVTAHLQEDTPSPPSAFLGVEMECREGPEEEVESGGGSEPEQKDKNETSFKHSELNVEEGEKEHEEEEEEEEETASKHARDNSDGWKNVEEQFDEEEDGQVCSCAEEQFQGSRDQEEVNEVHSDVEGLFVGGCSDEEENVEQCSDEEEAKGRHSDEEEAFEGKAVGGNSDEEKAVRKFINKDETDGELIDEEVAVGENSEEEGAVGENSDEEEAVGKYIYEEEAIGENSDEEGAVGEFIYEKKAVGENSDEEEAVGKFINEDGADGEFIDEEEAVGENSDAEGAVGKYIYVEEAVGENSDEEGAVGKYIYVEEAVGENSDEEGAVGKYIYEDGAVGENSDEEGAVGENSDEEGAVGENSDEEGAVGENSDEEGAFCDLQKGVEVFDEEEKNEHLMESNRSFLEDTDRAHSTLDDALQLICEGTTQGPRGHVRALCGLFEGQTGDHGGKPTGQGHT